MGSSDVPDDWLPWFTSRGLWFVLGVGVLGACGRYGFAQHEPAGDGGGAVCAPACDDGSWCDARTCEACTTAEHCGAGCVACTASALTCSSDGARCEPAADCSAVADLTICTVDTTAAEGIDREYDICSGGVCVSPGCGTSACNTPGPGFRLPDTHQRRCFDELAVIPCPGDPASATCSATPYCGQDAQYGQDVPLAQTRFERTEPMFGEPIVRDTTTGLIWQGCLRGASGAGCTVGTVLLEQWVDIRNTCDMLTWAGSSDWRFPDEFELHSLMHFDRSSAPHIDLAAFPSVTADVWGSGISVTDARYAWTVRYPLGDTVVAFGNARASMCVRRDSITSPRPRSRYSRTEPVLGEPVVVDGSTSLTWQGCVSGLRGAGCTDGIATTATWTNALAFCEGLIWGGRTNWRLPNAIELRSIVDPRIFGPAIDGIAFPATPTATPTQDAWTSTTMAPTPSAAWYVGFNYGRSSTGPKTDARLVRCVTP